MFYPYPFGSHQPSYPNPAPTCLGGHHELLAPLEVERHAPGGAEGAEGGAAPGCAVRVRARAALTPDGEGQG